MKKIIAFFMILGFASSSCEPDDICDPNTPTTPRMLIQFYYFDEPTVPRNVKNLKVIGEGMKEGVVLNPSATGDAQYLANGNNILIPLNTEADIVKYQFIYNYGDKNPLVVNTDNLEFKYEREQIYVSRACGFKVNYILNSKVILTDTTPADEVWIRHLIVAQKNIRYENETIIKIYF